MRTIKTLLCVAVILFPVSVFAQDYQVPVRTDDNVIVAAYNIKWFKMQNQNLSKLAGVIAHFDVCGILEVKSESAIADLVKELENQTQKDWGFTYNFRTTRPNGQYYESYAAVWRKDRAQLGDGVISSIWDINESHRNDPFTVSFSAKNFDFSLLLVHTRWTDDSDGSRAGEVKNVAGFVNSVKSYLPEQDIIVAGDFNYSGRANIMRNFARYTGMSQVDPNAKTTFKRNYSGYSSAYDHIYIGQETAPEFVRSHALDVTQMVYSDNSVASMRASKKELSDHLPVWAEFRTNLADDD